MKPVILDCTLRDGGYWNAWDFGPDLVQDYLNAMDAVGVNYIEMGFRSLQNTQFRGPYAFTTDDFLARLSVPDRLHVAVMVNANEMLAFVGGPVAALEKLFSPASDSPVSMVRIAAQRKEILRLGESFRWLKNQGYTTALNLMQISTLTDADFRQVGVEATSLQPDILYFADSLGGMTPMQISQMVRAVRATWDGHLGIHTHDNLGNALANTLRARDEGTTFLDCTVLGMGRGPGNVRTEHLIVELWDADRPLSELAPLIHLVNSHLLPLQQKLGWGTNLYYYLAGKHGIHPTYIQQMLADSCYGDEDILKIIVHLRTIEAHSYQMDFMKDGRNITTDSGPGWWSPAETIQGRDVLILGPGKHAIRHQAALEKFIATKKPFVIALNTLTTIAPDLIDVRTACHPIRLLADLKSYEELPQPIVLPAALLSPSQRNALSNERLLDFGVTVQENTFQFENTRCVIPSTLVLGYALAIATSGGSRRILLAGFDGYSADDPRQAEVADIFNCYLNHPQAVPLTTITLSSHALPASSVYGLC